MVVPSLFYISQTNHISDHHKIMCSSVLIISVKRRKCSYNIGTTTFLYFQRFTWSLSYAYLASLKAPSCLLCLAIVKKVNLMRSLRKMWQNCLWTPLATRFCYLAQRIHFRDAGWWVLQCLQRQKPWHIEESFWHEWGKGLLHEIVDYIEYVITFRQLHVCMKFLHQLLPD